MPVKQTYQNSHSRDSTKSSFKHAADEHTGTPSFFERLFSVGFSVFFSTVAASAFFDKSAFISTCFARSFFARAFFADADFTVCFPSATLFL